jgi:biofilm PGA synthesis N-glycosyltransferase PgaC
MKGWRVETFNDLIVNHHRCMASAGGLLRGRFRQGCKDFSFGYHPLFEVFKCARRLREKPVIVGGAVRFAGYCWSFLRHDRPAVPKEFVRFLQEEQLRRIRATFGLRAGV